MILSPPPVTVELVKYMLMAEDMDRAVGFYRDVFGLTPKLTSPHWSELAFGDCIVALHGGGSGEWNETGLSFQVTDLDAACRAVASAGGRIVEEPTARPGEPIRLARAVDPEGNQIMLTERVR